MFFSQVWSLGQVGHGQSEYQGGPVFFTSHQPPGEIPHAMPEFLRMGQPHHRPGLRTIYLFFNVINIGLVVIKENAEYCTAHI